MNRILFALFVFATSANADDSPSFRRDIAPILVKRCVGCHTEKKPQGGLSMKTFADLKKGGKTNGGEIVIAGDPENSGIIESIREDAKPRMPYKQPALPTIERDLLARWVKDGAKFDGPSETETSIASLVDVSANLPRIVPRIATSEPVTSLAISPDGKIAASAIGSSLVLFDLTSGEITTTLKNHPGLVTSVLFTPNGKTLIASGGKPGQFGSVRIWDVTSRTIKHEIRAHSDEILSADLSPDGSILVTGSYDRLVKLWDVSKGTEIRTLKEHTDSVHAVAFSPDGKLVASGGADRTIKVWDVATGHKRLTLGDSTAELYSVVFGADSKSLIGGGVDRSIRIWELKDDSSRVVRTAFAHEAAILRLILSKDRSILVSTGEDRSVKLWDVATLRPITAFENQSDWSPAIALTADAARLLIGRYDGSIDLFDRVKRVRILPIRGIGGALPQKPLRLVGNASLNPFSPRGLVRGQTIKATLSGTGVAEAKDVVLREDGVSAKLIPREKPAPNLIELELTASPDVRLGVHSLALRTPLGTTPFQSFVVSAEPESNEREPNEDRSKATLITLPATVSGAIELPGDIDLFAFTAKLHEELVFEVYANSIGSPLIAALSILSNNGEVLATSSTDSGKNDPRLVWKVPSDGTYFLKVEDADLGGSGAHLYRIRSGAIPYATSLSRQGLSESLSEPVRVFGHNLKPEPITIPKNDAFKAGETIALPASLTRDIPSLATLRMYVGVGPQGEEVNGNNDSVSSAETIHNPGGISARIDTPDDTDLFRFQANKGQPIVIETHARRLGSLADTVIEILDEKGNPIPRAVLRPVEETHVAFRDHGSASKSIRLTEWERFLEGDYVLCGREVMKIEDLPRNPDDDAVFWGTGGTRRDAGERMAFFGTTPEHHTLNQPIYKVEIHPPGTTFPKAGVAPTTLFYRNDDGGPGIGKDSYLTFAPPRTGTYFVRVQDVRGQSGLDYGYHLQIRESAPDFRLSTSVENPNIPRGGTAVVQVNATRIDGFSDPIDIQVVDLPPGVTAESSTIERDAFTASILFSASETAESFAPASWKITGTAKGSQKLTHTFDPGGPNSGFLTVRPEPPLKIIAPSDEIAIRPGQRIEMTLKVERGEGVKGRVPIDVRNLPRGVRVQNIGLNGILVTETQTERSIFIYAEPWAEPTSRPFFAVGSCEQTGTEHSSAPIKLKVVAPDGASAAR